MNAQRKGRRGMGMRDMKARQMGKAARIEHDEGNAKPAERGELPEGEEEMPDDPIETGMIIDQGDGMRVVRRGNRSAVEDQDSRDCPDEPPPGWGDG